MVTFGFSPATLEYYEKTGFQPILSYYATCDQETISVESLKMLCTSGSPKIRKWSVILSWFQLSSKSRIYAWRSFYDRYLCWRELPNWTVVDLNTYFAEILETYVAIKKKSGCLQSVGVSHKPGERKGFHRFWRSLATWMLENEVP
jgi:hypothetical protein